MLQHRLKILLHDALLLLEVEGVMKGAGAWRLMLCLAAIALQLLAAAHNNRHVQLACQHNSLVPGAWCLLPCLICQ